MRAMQARGYRNRNPGNIDWNPRNRWQGQVGIEATGSPPRFAVFESHEFGIRALAALLTTYQDRHNLRTIRGIISRWAPGTENNTDAYVHAVSRAMGVGANDPLDLHTYAHMRPLVEAIIAHELGGQPYSDAVLDEGLRLAGVPRPISTAREAASTGTGRGAAAVAGAVVAAAPAAPLLSALGDLPQWVGVAVVASVAVVALAWVLTSRARRAA
jgi:hypothetical protein